jgi:hypothetical protein
MIKIFEEVEGFVSNKLSSIKTTFSIFKLEARLAGLSVFPLLLNMCMLFVVLITLWLSTMTLIGYFCALFGGTFLSAVFLIFILNLGLFFGLIKYLTYNLDNMSFKKTRMNLSPRESSDDELKKTIDRKNYSDGKNIAKPTRQSD